MNTRIVLFPPSLDALAATPSQYSATVQLVEPDGSGWRPVIGFIDDMAIHGPTRFAVRGERVERLLAPNAQIRPAGTRWRIVLDAQDAGITGVVDLLDEAGPIHLSDLLGV